MSDFADQSWSVKAGQLRGFRDPEAPVMLILEVIDAEPGPATGTVKYMMDGQVKSGPIDIIRMYTEIIDETR